jgi:hypothetical protein
MINVNFVSLSALEPQPIPISSNNLILRAMLLIISNKYLP